MFACTLAPSPRCLFFSNVAGSNGVASVDWSVISQCLLHFDPHFDVFPQGMSTRRKSTGGIVKKHARTTLVSTTTILERDGEETSELLADYDELLASLKLPPPKLSWQNFADQYGLCNDGTNPHRWKKDHRVPEEKMEELFGAALGPSGRHGYHWADCKVQKVVDRITHLHPIVYQHSKTKIPKLIANRFAWGIAYEYFEDKPVSWAMFAAGTNNTQQRTYLSDVTKINWCKQQGIKVTFKSWRGVNVPSEFKAAAFEEEGKPVSLW